jgi:hypothetical protein
MANPVYVVQCVVGLYDEETLNGIVCIRIPVFQLQLSAFESFKISPKSEFEVRVLNS